MRTQRLTEQFQNIIDLAADLAGVVAADALMIMLEGQADWDLLREAVGEHLAEADLAFEGIPQVDARHADARTCLDDRIGEAQALAATALPLAGVARVHRPHHDGARTEALFRLFPLEQSQALR